MAEAEDIALANAALRLVGANTITDFTDTSREGEVTDELYEENAEARLGAHRWSFAKKQVALVINETDPVAKWTKKWDLPSDLIVIHSIRVNDIITKDYERYSDGLYCNFDDNNTVVMEYGFRQTTDLWPAIFRKAFRYEMMAEYAMAIKRNESQGVKFSEAAEKLFERARLMFAQEHGMKRVDTSAFLAARR